MKITGKVNETFLRCAMYKTPYLKMELLARQAWTHCREVYCCSAISLVRLFETPLQHSKCPCPSPSPGACSDSGPLSQWCHPTISSSVMLFSHPQSFPASGSGLFQWVSSSKQVATVLELQLHHQSFQWIFRVDFLYDWNKNLKIPKPSVSEKGNGTPLQ